MYNSTCHITFNLLEVFQKQCLILSYKTKQPFALNMKNIGIRCESTNGKLILMQTNKHKIFS